MGKKDKQNQENDEEINKERSKKVKQNGLLYQQQIE